MTEKCGLNLVLGSYNICYKYSMVVGRRKEVLFNVLSPRDKGHILFPILYKIIYKKMEKRGAVSMYNYEP